MTYTLRKQAWRKLHLGFIFGTVTGHLLYVNTPLFLQIFTWFESETKQYNKITPWSHNIFTDNLSNQPV